MIGEPCHEPYPPNDDPGAALRRGVYLLLICVGVGAMLGRILAVDTVDRRPWKTYRVKAQLDEKRRELEKKGIHRQGAGGNPRGRQAADSGRPWPYAGLSSAPTTAAAGPPSGPWSSPTCACRAPLRHRRVVQQPNWDTIDMVKHDGHLYSSKPPLLADAHRRRVLGHLSADRQVAGHASLRDRPLHARHAQRDSAGDLLPAPGRAGRAAGKDRLGPDFRHGRGRVRHVPDHLRRRAQQPCPRGRLRHDRAVCRRADLVRRRAPLAIFRRGGPVQRAVGGRRAARAVADGRLGPGAALEGPAADARSPGCRRSLLVAAGFFGTNWIAHHSLRPPYLHNKGTDDWYDYTYKQRDGRLVESYWKHPQGVDSGEPSLRVYVFHALIGHHGIFSLTPIWLLSVAGTLVWLFQRRDPRLRELALLIGAVTVVCVGFYFFCVPVDKRSYGGVNCGFRWVFWLTPLWLVVMVPAVDFLARRRWTMVLAALLLMCSVVSVSYPTWNPWTQPWLMDYLKYLGRI